MAGVPTDTPRGPLALASIVASAAVLLALLALGPARSDAAGTGGVKAETTCPKNPAGLSPKGPAPNRFTMLIRINQQVNANTWNSFDESAGGLGGRVRPQDIFVINTRYEASDPVVATEIANSLAAAHPCNRIVALNGMSFDPTRPGYAFTLIEHPAVWAVMTDFETGDWNDGRSTDPGRPPWSYGWSLAYPRIKQWNGRLAKKLASNPAALSKRSGLVPLDISTWNYGSVAQNLDKRNSRLGGRHLGPLSVQSQDYCANGGASTYRSRSKAIFDQYRFKYVTKTVKGKKGKKRKVTIRRKLKKRARPSLQNLSLQISFSNTPSPSATMAITKTSAKTAAACTRAALKQGAGAFFYFASPDSMRVLFSQPEISSLRPSAAAAKKKKKKG